MDDAAGTPQEEDRYNARFSLPAPGETEEVVLDEETLEQLRAVGYLGGDADDEER